MTSNAVNPPAACNVEQAPQASAAGMPWSAEAAHARRGQCRADLEAHFQQRPPGRARDALGVRQKS